MQEKYTENTVVQHPITALLKKPLRGFILGFMSWAMRNLKLENRDFPGKKEIP
jgi:hypothetical protein